MQKILFTADDKAIKNILLYPIQYYSMCKMNTKSTISSRDRVTNHLLMIM